MWKKEPSYENISLTEKNLVGAEQMNHFLTFAVKSCSRYLNPGACFTYCRKTDEINP